MPNVSNASSVELLDLKALVIENAVDLLLDVMATGIALRK